MKKFCLMFLVFCFTLFAGVFLYGCQDSFEIKITKTNDGENLYSIEIKDENEALLSSPSFTVSKDINLRVKISATQTGVDFSNFQVVINNKKQQVFTYNNYDMFDEKNLLYGYFLLPRINEDKDINFSGASTFKTNFNFKDINLEDEEIAQKASITQIEIENNFINLIDFMQSKASFTKTYGNEDKNSFYSFKLKFDKVAPFSFSADTFLTIIADGEIKNSFVEFENQEYTFFFEEMQDAKDIEISLNFDNVEYAQYAIILPKENLSYKLECDKTITSYNEEATFTFYKLNSEIDYSSVEIYANEYLLTKLNENEDTIEFQLPKYTTALSQDEREQYYVKVSGIVYPSSVYKLSYQIEQPDGEIDFETKIREIDQDGNELGITSIDEYGNELGLEGKRYAFFWNYVYDRTNSAYNSRYDLTNYSIKENEQNLFNLAEILEGKTTSFEIEIGEYLLKATFNSQTQTFDQFALEFDCTKQVEFGFSNLMKFENNIKISFDFDDDRIDLVEVLIATGVGANWNSLIKSQVLTVDIASDINISFRITSRENISSYDFDIEGKEILQSIKSQKIYSNNKYYITYDCTLLNLQFNNSKSLILIKL